MNNIKIIGIVKDRFKFLYEYENERFYLSYLESLRTSGNIDTLPLVSSENITDLEKIKVGDVIEVIGEIRTRNDNGKVRVFIFSSDINKTGESEVNKVVCDGYVCKPPIYRTTPFGREITDLIIASPRRYGTDFLPCVSWGRMAKYARSFNVGDKVNFTGRFQSREYSKGVAYEISIIKISNSSDDRRN